MSPVITIGADPEVAVRSISQKRYVSAVGLIPGNKYEPAPVKDGQILVDGLMLEYGIDPASNKDEFIKRNQSLLDTLAKMIGDDHKIVIEPTVIFDKYFMEAIPDSDKELGCAPDFNAWEGGTMNPRPLLTGMFVHTRVCGGHIHIGWTSGADVSSTDHIFDCCTIVKYLDTFVHPYLAHMDKGDKIRSQMYGALGAFRPKPYGVEWRVPSNTWLSYPQVWGWLFDTIKIIVSTALDPKRCTSLPILKDKEILEKRKSLSLTYLIHEDSYSTNTNSIRSFAPGYNSFPYIADLYAEDFDGRAARQQNELASVRVASTSGKFHLDLDLNIDDDGSGWNYVFEAPSAKVVIL